jgi:carboxypeptidase C (cathepsin A)
MGGLFTGIGPCNIDSNIRPYKNQYSWTNVTNMLFIDQPTQVGFSYSIPIRGYKANDTIIPISNNECPGNTSSCGTWSLPNLNLTSNTTPGGAPNFWKTLQGFVGAFPQYSKKGVILASESFGGHYGPVYSEYIMRQNNDLPQGAISIPLIGLSIANGLSDPLLQIPTYYNFTLSSGNPYDLKLLNQSMEQNIYNSLYQPGGCVDKIKTCYANGTNEQCSDAGDVCYSSARVPFEKYSGRNVYDIRYPTPNPFSPSYFAQYLNTEKVHKAIGAYTNFSKTSTVVENAYLATGDDMRVLSIMDDLRRLVKRGVMVLLYYGDADFICNWIGGEAVANTVGIHKFEKAGYVNITTPDHVVHGQVKQAGHFAFARIYESGHAVPFHSPIASLEMLRRIANGVDIASGKRKSGKWLTIGSARSTFREGNGTVQWKPVPLNASSNIITNQPNF